MPSPASPQHCFADEFPLRDGLIYLTHAAVAPWPRRTAAAMQRFAEVNATEGARHYPRRAAVEAALRAQLRAILNAPHVDDIALLKNTSEGLTLVDYELT